MLGRSELLEDAMVDLARFRAGISLGGTGIFGVGGEATATGLIVVVSWAVVRKRAEEGCLIMPAGDSKNQTTGGAI